MDDNFQSLELIAAHFSSRWKLAMKDQCENIKRLAGQSVSFLFSDGCSMDVRIVSIAHLDEGGDFVAEVLNIRCNISEHWHPSPGTFLNIKAEEVTSIEHMDQSDEPTDK